MKRKITKAEFDALHDEVKKLYTADGDSYLLKLADDDDPAELRRARDREKEAAKLAKERADAAEAKLADITNVTARKAGDIVTLEKSWQDKLDAEKASAAAKLQSKDAFIRKALVTSVAVQLATKLAGDNADILLPHIVARLSADLDGAEPTTRVLDGKGNISALSIDDLEKEFVANSRFGAIIIASKASGGAGGGGTKPAAVPKDKKFGELNDAERTAWFKGDPEGFRKASTDYQLSLRKF